LPVVLEVSSAGPENLSLRFSGVAGYYRAVIVLFAQETFLGKDLLAWLVLALGGALVAGNALALARPPKDARKGDLERAPVGRSVTMLIVGLVAAIWALATLTS
jgi:hypothetical protein